MVSRSSGARLDPIFESGATNLLNAMKAAACLMDLDLAGMREVICLVYRAVTRMKVELEELNRPGVQLAGAPVTCP